MAKIKKKFWKITTDDGEVLLVKSPKPPKYATRWTGEATQIRPTGRSMMGFREVESRPDLPTIPYAGHALYERRKDAKAAADNCVRTIRACGSRIEQSLRYAPIKNRSVIAVTAEEIDKDTYLVLKGKIERKRASVARQTHDLPPVLFDGIGTKEDVERWREFASA